MSGSGGYYKYRCKYWLTYNCPNWVWVNNAPCAHCLADGRDSAEAMMASSFPITSEVYVPHLENGFLSYIAKETTATGDRKSGWVVKDEPVQPLSTMAKPRPVSYTAMDDGE